MMKKDEVVAAIHAAFGANEYPGDAFLLGSREGCEPEDEVGPFRGKTDWRAVDAAFLDAHAGALHFLSEAGLRFFLPAYLVADVRGELQYAEPEFTLTGAFSDASVRVTHAGREFELRSGKSQFLNPRRFGASTFLDYARYRLSIFNREEAKAIVAYLEYKRDSAGQWTENKHIDAALGLFWKERARVAPEASALRAHIKEQEEYLAAVKREREELR